MYIYKVGGNIIRPVPGDPTRTHFTVLTHVNPGGADSIIFFFEKTNQKKRVNDSRIAVLVLNMYIYIYNIYI